MSVEGFDYANIVQETTQTAQFSTEELAQLSAVGNRYKVDGSHDNLMSQEDTYPFYERYPGYVEERFQALIEDSRERAAHIKLPRVDHAKQLTEIDDLREDLYRALPDARPKPGEIEDRAYDIVKDVWNFRKLQKEIALLTPIDKKNALQIFEKYIELQMRTFLEEIGNVYGHKTLYTFENNIMFMNALSKKQSFEEIIAFGLAVEEHEGSVESKRIEDELRGCIQLGEFGRFANVGDRYILISPRGIHKNTKYKRNYIDIGEKKVDPKTGEVYLEVTRFKSPHAHEEYTQIILNSIMLVNNKNFFKNADPSNLDGYYLSHLLIPDKNTLSLTVEGLYESLFDKHHDAISEEEFMRRIYVNCFPEVKAYIHLVGTNADWETIAEAYTAIVNKCASFITDVRKPENRSIVPHNTIINFDNDDWQKDIAMASANGLQNWGRRAMVKLDADCGSVKAYLSIVDTVTTTAILESLTLANKLENSVAQTGIQGLGLEDGKGPLEFLCEPPKGCGKMIKRPWGKLISNCYLCGTDLTCGISIDINRTDPETMTVLSKKEKERRKQPIINKDVMQAQKTTESSGRGSVTIYWGSTKQLQKGLVEGEKELVENHNMYDSTK